MIRETHPHLEKLVDPASDTTRSWRVPGYKGKIGFISSMSDHFCGGCSRLRVAANGSVKVRFRPSTSAARTLTFRARRSASSARLFWLSDLSFDLFRTTRFSRTLAARCSAKSSRTTDLEVRRALRRTARVARWSQLEAERSCLAPSLLVGAGASRREAARPYVREPADLLIAQALRRRCCDPQDAFLAFR